MLLWLNTKILNPFKSLFNAVTSQLMNDIGQKKRSLAQH